MINMDVVDEIAENVGGYGHAHLRRLRPNSGSESNDQSNGSDNETLDATDALLN
jgi:hypothetical protein